MSTAARRAHTHQLRRRHDPSYRWYAGDCGNRKHLMVRITGNANGALRELGAAQLNLGRIATWSAQHMAELANAMRRARELCRYAMWRRIAQVDPRVRVFTVTIATPTGSECRLVVQHHDWRRMQAPTTEKE